MVARTLDRFLIFLAIVVVILAGCVCCDDNVRENKNFVAKNVDSSANTRKNLDAIFTPISESLSVPSLDQYLILSLSNQVNFCKSQGSNCMKEVVQDAFRENRLFTIHGLWGEGVGDFCEHTEKMISPDTLEALRNALETSWPDAKITSSGLWQHEWNKHGKCIASSKVSPHVKNSYDYLSYTIKLFSRIDANFILSKHGLRPSFQPVLVSDILKAFKESLGTRVLVRKGYSIIDGVTTIGEIFICVNPATDQLIDCPIEERHFLFSPKEHVIIPPIEHINN